MLRLVNMLLWISEFAEGRLSWAASNIVSFVGFAVIPALDRWDAAVETLEIVRDTLERKDN